MTKTEYQSVLFEELEKLRKEFKTITNPGYYRLMPDIELVKLYFMDQCIMEVNTEFPERELGKAIQLNELIQFFEGELILLDPKLIRTTFDLHQLQLVINGLISMMVPNSETMTQLMKAFDQVDQSLKNRKPIRFIEQDLIDDFCPIFQAATLHLQHLLDHQPAELKALYAASQIRTMDYLAVKAQNHGQAMKLCIANLRKIFQSEMQYKKNQDICKQLPIEHFLTKDTEAPVMEKLSFGYKKSPGFLLPIVKALILKINFLDFRTSAEEFVRIVTSDDLGSIQEKIYLGCKTNEFRYLIQHFEPFFRSFTCATIGRSGIFISNTDTPVTANSLYNTTTERMQTKWAIDNIFNKRG